RGAPLDWQIVAIRASSQRCRSMTTVCTVCARTPRDVDTEPELRIPGAAAQTRVVAMARIWLRLEESARAFKGIICDPAAAPRGLRIKRIEKSPPRWPATRSAVTWIERANSDISRGRRLINRPGAASGRA